MLHLCNDRFYAAEVVLALEYLHCMGKGNVLRVHCPRIMKCESIFRADETLSLIG